MYIELFNLSTHPSEYTDPHIPVCPLSHWTDWCIQFKNIEEGK